MCTTCGCGEGNLYIEGDEQTPLRVSQRPFAPAPRQTMTITGVKTDTSPPPAREGDLHYGHGEAGPTRRAEPAADAGSGNRRAG
jgi:hydrogenase nickel incorporation protein HypB